MKKLTMIEDTIRVGNEDYVWILDLKKYIETNNNIVFDNCIITPYYILMNNRYEFYQYEFVIDKSEKTFENFMLRISEKNSIENVDDNILKTRKMCFDNNDKTAKENIVKWIDFLINSETVRKEVESLYGEYNVANLYVEIYLT